MTLSSRRNPLKYALSRGWPQKFPTLSVMPPQMVTYGIHWQKVHPGVEAALGSEPPSTARSSYKINVNPGFLGSVLPISTACLQERECYWISLKCLDSIFDPVKPETRSVWKSKRLNPTNDELKIKLNYIPKQRQREVAITSQRNVINSAESTKTITTV